jgi:hypothetical protein
LRLNVGYKTTQAFFGKRVHRLCNHAARLRETTV